jgi:predicted ATPase
VKLLELEVRGFRGAPDGVWSLHDARSGVPHELAVIAGDNGSGKTSLLLAIAFLKEAVGTYGGRVDYEGCVRAGEVEGQVSARWLLDEDERRVAGVTDSVQRTAVGIGRRALPPPSDGLRRLFRSYAHGSRLGKLELFAANRSLGLHGLSRSAAPIRSEAIEGRLRTGRRPDKYFDVPGWVLETASRDALVAAASSAATGMLLAGDTPDSLAGFRRGIGLLAPHLRFDGVEVRNRATSLRFLRSNGRPVLLEDLSDSEHEAVLFSGTFARIGLCRSVVLVDTPERSIATERQGAFVQALASLGKDNQLIVASSSSAVVAAVQPSRVLRLPSSVPVTAAV